MAQRWDVVVIGGGPAGAAAAITAGKHGHRVLLLEADRFPRAHVGESLVYLWAAFESLGVADTMDETFLHKFGGTRIWGSDDTPTYANFQHLQGRRKYSLQVERSLFDLILLRRAEEVGVTVREESRVLEVAWDGERAAGVRYRSFDGAEHDVSSRFVIDASGRRSLIARDRGLQIRDSFYPDLAVYAYFSGSEHLPDGHEGDVLIETLPSGWLWHIPLHTGEVSVGLVCDTSSRPLLRQRGIESFFAGEIARSRHVAGLLAPATRERGPIATASSGYSSRQYAGPGWMLAGDAAFFTDPMWATGVGNALSNGILAGATTDAVLQSRVDEPRAVAYYDRELRGIVSSVDATIKQVYSSNRLHADSPFWAERHRYLTESPPEANQVTTVFGPSFGRTLARLAASVSAS